MWSGIGEYGMSPRSEGRTVSAVRGAGYEGMFSINDNDTVTDIATGLTWHQDTPVNYMNWKQALLYCENSSFGGYTDWRLPNIKELQTIVAYNRYSPAINTTYFPDTLIDYPYWSSSSCMYAMSNAECVSFDRGFNQQIDKNARGYVLLVRGEQSVALGNLVISPISRNVSKDAGTTTFSVSNTGTGTMPWTASVTSGGGWLSITSGAIGNNAGTITCSFSANTTISSRTAIIRISASGATGSPMDVTVIQAPTTTPTPSPSPSPTPYPTPTPTPIQIPGAVAVSPTSGSWTSADQTISVSSANASQIEYAYNKTTDGSVPADPSDPGVSPTANEIRGNISGSSGGFTVPSSTGAITKIKIKFCGKNSTGYGPNSQTCYYAIDLRTPTPTPSPTPGGCNVLQCLKCVNNVCVTPMPSPTACTATIDGSLLLHIPYLSYVNPNPFFPGTISLWADLVYDFNPTYPTLILFKLTKYGILDNPSFSCAASTLSNYLNIHIPDVLFSDGTTNLWVDLQYSSTLSNDGNFYWVVSNYGTVSN